MTTKGIKSILNWSLSINMTKDLFEKLWAWDEVKWWFEKIKELNELIQGGLYSPLGFGKFDYSIDYQEPQPFDPEYEKPSLKNANKKLANIKLVVNKD